MEQTGERRVTHEDVDLVLTSMIRREIGWFRTVGWVAEIVGWATVAGALLVGAVQWSELDFTDVDGNGIERWRSVAAFLLPQVLNLGATGLLLVVAGRGGRLLALHLAAGRKMNLTGLVVGEPLDDLDLPGRHD
jgi:hypothetical protein